MPHPFGDEGGHLFDIEGLLLAHSEEYRGSANVFSIKNVLFHDGEGVLGALGEVGLGVGEDILCAAVFPGIFSVEGEGGGVLVE